MLNRISPTKAPPTYSLSSPESGCTPSSQRWCPLLPFAVCFILHFFYPGFAVLCAFLGTFPCLYMFAQMWRRRRDVFSMLMIIITAMTSVGLVFILHYQLQVPRLLPADCHHQGPGLPFRGEISH